MSPQNGSIANLSVTRKTLSTRADKKPHATRYAPFSPALTLLASRKEKRGDDANRSSGMKIKSRRLDGAGLGSSNTCLPLGRLSPVYFWMLA